MKKQAILIIIATYLTICASTAQDLLTYRSDGVSASSENPGKASRTFEFKAYDKESEIESIPEEMAGTHEFGILTAKKLYLFEKRYTSQVAVVPGNPQMRTVIKKPVIYDAVKKIEKDLKKTVKKGVITKELAAAEFNVTLDVALNIVTADTKEFEDEISAAKNINRKTELFTKQVKLKY